jgi:membrane protease YdiL (CAAX protease family)
MAATSEAQARPPAPNGSHNCGDVGCTLLWESRLEAMRPSYASGGRRSTLLAMETAIVVVAAIAAVRVVNVQSAMSFKWLLIPCLLVIAALLPTWLRKSQFPPICTDGRHAAASIAVASLTCLCAIPAVFLGLWLMIRMHLPIPLRPTVAGSDAWFTWLIYQLMYVAVAEEMFFRGYFQVNVTTLLGDMKLGSRPIGRYLAVVASAGCFALAHVVVQGQITSLITFLPGLVLAWLFLRTQSLLAPILFHGLANVSYGIIALILM